SPKMVFYSDGGEPNVPADVGIPTSRQTNLSGPFREVNNFLGNPTFRGFSYTPGVGQAGFVTGGVTYTIVRGGVVAPGPSTAAMALIGLASCAFAALARSRRTA